MKSLVFLHNTTGFVKFGSSGTLISNFTKSLLFLSPCFRASVVSFSFTLKLRNELAARHNSNDMKSVLERIREWILEEERTHPVPTANRIWTPLQGGDQDSEGKTKQ